MERRTTIKQSQNFGELQQNSLFSGMRKYLADISHENVSNTPIPNNLQIANADPNTTIDFVKLASLLIESQSETLHLGIEACS